ncbi:hypothetical protein [Patulibacter sp. SYSU D01012]|uniref:hypothetical protein n=1 Tax=Patulibacter sp. SYSU D01012 TaxID=2817381 RepID=UPI001B30E422|nr:hypothetical protein [Patulibacter sp. SYSU D01012]
MAEGKRKRKRGTRPAGTAGPGAATATVAAEPPAPPAADEAGGGRGAMTRGYAKAEQKNVAAREALEPLHGDERPGVVVAAVVWLALIAAGMVYTAITAEGDNAGSTRLGNVAMIVLIVVAAVGTWRLKYWAILGTQTILALSIVIGFVALVTLTKAWLVPLAVAQPLISAVLFFRMVKVMARVQKAELIRRGEVPADRPSA